MHVCNVSGLSVAKTLHDIQLQVISSRRGPHRHLGKVPGATGTKGSKCRTPRIAKVRSRLEKRRGLWIST